MDQLSEFHLSRRQGNLPLSISRFERAIQEGATVLDCRPANQFESGFIRQSISIPYSAFFNQLIDLVVNKEGGAFVLVAPLGMEDQLVANLKGMGFGNILGFLDGGFQAWLNAKKRFDLIPSLTVEDLILIMEDEDCQIVETSISKPLDFHLHRAQFIPLNALQNGCNRLNETSTLLIYSETGTLSSVLASILYRKGFTNILCAKEALAELSKKAPQLISA